MTLRSRRLEALLGARFEDLTYGHFQAVQGSPSSIESDDLDWKVKYDGDKNTANFEIAKDVAALANATGGLLVIGVAQDKLTSAAQKIIDQPATDLVERQFHQAIAAGVFPMPRYRIRRLANPASDGTSGLILIAVPASPLAPHAVLAAQRPDYAYPRRAGNKIEWLTEPEIATAYRRRFAESSSREERLKEVEDDCVEAFFEAGALEPLLTVALVPEIAGSYRIDRRALEALRTDSLGPLEIGSNIQRSFTDVTVASARLQLTETAQTPAIHCDLHADGSGAWGVVPFVDDLSADETAGGIQIHYLVTQILNALSSLARHATERAGVTGTARVRASLWASVYEHSDFAAHGIPTFAGGSGEPAYDNLQLGSYQQSCFTIEGTRAIREAHGEIVCLLESTGLPGVGLTQTAALLINSLLQTAGIIENSQIDRDGAVRTWAFPHEEERWWIRWCEDNGIPFRRSGP